MDDQQAPTQRVSAVPFPERYQLPDKPGWPPSAVDAHRQSAFVLHTDLRLIERAMNLQLDIVRASSHSSFRKHPYAAMMGLWSRTFSTIADICLLAMRASYESCAPLAKSACEYIAAEERLHRTRFEAFVSWLRAGFGANSEYKATDIGLGSFPADAVRESDGRLRSVYVAARELSRPSFGATLLAIGPESNNARLALTFADTTFHVGWAELVLGWLLALCEAQIALVASAGGIFAIGPETAEAIEQSARGIEASLSRTDRCRIEEIDVDGHKRYLVYNFRRLPSGAPKKILL